MTTLRYFLSELTQAGTNNYSDVNKSLAELDSIINPTISSDIITVVPTVPVSGVLYRIGTGGTGILAGNGGNILYYYQTSLGLVPKIVTVPAGYVLSGTTSSSGNWGYTLLANNAAYLVPATVSVAIPPGHARYVFLIATGATLTLTSGGVINGASSIVGGRLIEVISVGANIYVG
jgi:Protein of unknown function (DUF2793)